MSLYKELSYDDHEIDTIKRIQFCILSPDEIKKRSVVEVTKTDTYIAHEPVFNGLFDKRMGVIDHNAVCLTCEQKNTFCPGHFGHIQLAKPVFHVHYFDTCKKLLKCICFKCSKLLADPNNDLVKNIQARKISRQKKWEQMHKVCAKIRKCDGCGAKQPDKITKEGILKIAFEWKDLPVQNEQDRKQILCAEDALRIFKRISDADADLLGFSYKYNRPEWMICTVLVVPPPSVRPTVKTDTGQRQEDDLTHKLINIVKVNNSLKAKIDKATKDQIDIMTQLLQYEVATLIDNNIPGIPQSQQRTGRPIRSLTERLKSKEGRIRGNLMGKRVDFSARSVITPDPNISIDELGVPLKIAMNLTFPEIVNKYNKVEMHKLVENGPDTYPGAKYVRKSKDHRTIRLKGMTLENRAAIVLEQGDVVERHLRNGDYVLFNRQPSLHRMSMMGHRVRVMPYNTFRLNVCVTPNFNADFDGDEMNAHIPQSLQTQEELIQLAAVPTQIISPRECKPIISIVQDICLGVYRITKNNVEVSEKQLFNLVCSNPKFCNILPPPDIVEGNVRKWTGKQVLSTIIPPVINIGSKEKVETDPVKKQMNDLPVIIDHGHILQGTFDKDTYQARTRGLVHSIYNECGMNEARLFFDNTQKLICDWLVLSGFSVGISDLVVGDDTKQSFKETIRNMKVNVYDILKQVHLGKFENSSTKNNMDYFETKVNTILNAANRDIGEKGQKEIKDNMNRMINMIKAKSKGNTINVAQMIGCLGQQNVDGKRIPYGFDFRTLPHYTKYDDGPESRGFVENSFISGLTPQEFFFHSMGGREGLIDTAVKTSETGYIQRKLVKAMEDCKINYDYTVRNASGSIIQFLYGEDGMDSIKIESQQLPYIDKTPSDIKDEYFIYPDLEDIRQYLYQSVYESLKKDTVFEQRMTEHLNAIYKDREYLIVDLFKCKYETSIMYPIGFMRIITNIKAHMNKYDTNYITDLDPRYVLDAIDKLTAEIYVTKNNPANRFFGILTRCYLSPKKVITQYRFNKDAFDMCILKIKQRFFESIAHPSEMVGIVAAQSIGEPTTQLTLNTFHMSGVSSASSAVRGVPRLKELLHCTNSKNIKTPVMTIMLKEMYQGNKHECVDIMNMVKTTRFRDIVKRSKIYFDPSNAETNINEDTPFVTLFNEFMALDNSGCDKKYSPWILRLELDKSKMLDLKLTMQDVDFIISDFYDNTIQCVFSDDNAANLVMRIRLSIDDESDILTELKALEHNIMENIVVKGIKNIERGSMREESYNRYNISTSQFEKCQEWILYTDGTNLLEVLGSKFVDSKRTITNDINEIYNVLGIEAARQALYDEIVDVLQSTTVNYRHIALLVDTMTNKGTLVSIDRHGINQGDIGPLAKCSFEETTDRLIKAGIFAERDRINGVSANIMLGQIAPCGTGDCDLYIDVEKLTSIPEIDVESDEDQEELIVDDSLCNMDNLKFEFDMDMIKTDDSAVKRDKLDIYVK